MRRYNKTNHFLFSMGVTLLLGGCTPPPPPPAPEETAQQRCERLRGKALDGASITEATLVAASNTLPEYCKVTGLLPADLQFEVRLPSDWNGKTVYAGGGGFDGAIPSTDAYTARGYTAIASNGGHTGLFDGSFALNTEMLADFADRSIHRVLPFAKDIIRERYGRNSEKTYFEGCSNGGREALIEAQRWPDDFDGIVASAPAYNYVELLLAFNRNFQQLSKPGANFSAARLATLGKAVLDACDDKDGLVDGIISHPAACQFEPGTLQCTGADQDTCLTAEQVASARTIYSPMRLEGIVINEGWPAGGEADPLGWAPWMTGNGNALFSGGGLFQLGMVRYFITRDPNHDTLAFAPQAWLPRISEVSAQVSANSADLERFRARGGKLILWHGGTDAAISQNGTAAYYQRVVQTSGGQAAADSFVEYFPAPGVNHCGGGPGADSVNLLSALEDWVEKGIAPSSANLVATKVDLQTGAPLLARPLCKYPLYPRYKGEGDPASAASFTCAAP
jgi:pimeloyl-ACP methyl ester carboxylesterase